MVRYGECGQIKDKWGELHGPLRQWGAGEYYHTEVCKRTFPTSGTDKLISWVLESPA